MDISKVIRDIPDFPKPGILFKDITPVMENPAAFRFALDGMEFLLADVAFDAFAAIESRGFVFGAPLGVDMDKSLVLVRKAGKLPSKTRSVTYDLEYGQATIEMHVDSLKPGDRVVIVDDLLATGGTVQAVARLVSGLGAEIAGIAFVIELDFLKGRGKIKEYPVYSIIKY